MADIAQLFWLDAAEGDIDHTVEQLLRHRIPRAWLLAPAPGLSAALERAGIEVHDALPNDPGSLLDALPSTGAVALIGRPGRALLDAAAARRLPQIAL